MKDSKKTGEINEINEDPFEEYIRLGEPDKADKAYFTGVYSHAGKIRDYNIRKDELVLDGASVMYGGALELRETLEYDFKTEQEFSYVDMTMSEIIKHLARFVSRLWQIHIFCEGNTRTTAVFFIEYLRSMGFDVTNDVFAKNAWYFRNSLVSVHCVMLKLI